MRRQSGRGQLGSLWLAAGVALAALVLSACGGGRPATTKARSVSVFDLRPHECLIAPAANPNLQVATVRVVPCRSPHTEEVYCVLPYSPTLPQIPPSCPAEPPRYVGLANQDYPGDKALETFANAVCLDEFQPYVGAKYTDSALYYTYLYPSARSWDSPSHKDRAVTCVLVSPLKALTRSAKGSRL